MIEFTAIPSATSKGTRAPRIRQAQFNNQFEQREVDFGVGLATARVATLDPDFRLTDLMVWDLQFLNRTAAELDGINATFVLLGGAGKFLWTPPRPFDVHGQRFYVCETWDWTYNRGGVVAGITARFEEQPPIL